MDEWGNQVEEERRVRRLLEECRRDIMVAWTRALGAEMTLESCLVPMVMVEGIGEAFRRRWTAE